MRNSSRAVGDGIKASFEQKRAVVELKVPAETLTPRHQQTHVIAMDDQQMSDIYAFAVQLGKDAGDMLMAAARARIDGQQGSGSYDEKESSVDIVTKTDNGIHLRTVIILCDD